MSKNHLKVHYTKLFINNEFVDSEEGLTLDTYNPATEEKISTVSSAGVRDIEKAIRFDSIRFDSIRFDSIRFARASFDSGPWSKISSNERQSIIYKFAELIQANTDYLADLESTDNGKPRSGALIDIGMAVDVLKYYAGFATKIHGKTYPVSGIEN